MYNYTTLGTIFLTLFAIFSSGLDSSVRKFKYGPSLTSLPSPVLKLEDYPNYSVLVPLTKYKISAYPYELAQEDSRWRDIKAIIKAPEGYRVMMVVQILYLGLGYDEKLNNEFQEAVGLKTCIDSIQIFEHGDLVHEICGTVNYTDRSANPSSLTGPRTYLSKGGSLIVGMQFAKSLRQSSDSHLLHLEYRHKVDIWSRKFSLLIAFTGFKECEDVSKSSGEDSFRPCSGDLSSEGESDIHFNGHFCIHSDLFCDGVMNCPEEAANLTIGSDENKDQCSLSSLQNSEISSPMVNFRPDDKYHINTFRPPIDNNFHHTDLSLGPSSTVLLIVLTILSVMILGVIIRLCCTKCAGTPLPAPTHSTDSEAASNSVWTVTPICSSHVHNGGSGFPPNFIAHSQCSRFNALKDHPPSYEDLFPIESPKSEIQIQTASLPNSSEIPNGRNHSSNENLYQETSLVLVNNDGPKDTENT